MPTRVSLSEIELYTRGAIRIGLILIFAYLAAFLMERLIRGLHKYSVRAMTRGGGTTEFELEKRARTISGVARKALAILIWSIALFMILNELGLDIRPLLAGAGIVGVAVGFGAQNLFKDVISGLFLLLENQIRVNDVVVINGTGGLVEEINLRTTLLRGENGAVHVFPNGAITSLSNLTRDYSYYVFELLLDGSVDPDRAFQVLKKISEEVASEEPYRQAVLAPLEVIGVDKVSDAGVVIKARIKTLPIKQWLVGREMNRRIKKRFAEEGINLPLSVTTVRFAPELPPDLKRQLRIVIREIMDEGGRESGGPEPASPA